MMGRNLLSAAIGPRMSKSGGARFKEKTIHNALSAKELAPMRVSGFRDFALSGENAEGLSARVAASAESACLGLKSKFVDSQALDFCFEGRIGDAELRRCASWS